MYYEKARIEKEKVTAQRVVIPSHNLIIIISNTAYGNQQKFCRVSILLDCFLALTVSFQYCTLYLLMSSDLGVPHWSVH